MFDETFRQAWTERYGEQPSFDFPEIAPFLRHRSVRKFSKRPVDETLMSALIAAAQSPSTSSSLQLWSVVSVKDPGTRGTIAKHCDNYRHIVDAGLFLLFVADHYRLK